MLRLRLSLICALTVSCFSDPEPTASGTTDAGTASSGAATAGDETGFIDQCRACQQQECAGYAQACGADLDCDACVDAPFNLTCLSDDAFRPLAHCSCESCPEACAYMCPGEAGACPECSIESGCNPAACFDDMAECAPCIEDPFQEGCQEDPVFMPIQDCTCMACGPECVWQCPDAATNCAGCLSQACVDQLGACMAETECTMCFDNPGTPGCDENVGYGALRMCVCAMCVDPCGLLFDC